MDIGAFKSYKVNNELSFDILWSSGVDLGPRSVFPHKVFSSIVSDANLD